MGAIVREGKAVLGGGENKKRVAPENGLGGYSRAFPLPLIQLQQNDKGNIERLSAPQGKEEST